MPSSKLNIKTVFTSPRKNQNTNVDAGQINRTFEHLLDEQEVSHSLRDKLRSMDPFVKQSFIEVTTNTPVTPDQGTRKHSRHRSLIFLTPSKRKKQESDVLEDMNDPTQFIKHLNAKTGNVKLPIICKLKLLLRSQRIAWTTEFAKLHGTRAIHDQIQAIAATEWRDDADDKLLSEVLACAQSICTVCMPEVLQAIDGLLTSLVELLFGERQPSDFRARAQIFNILHSYLNATTCRQTRQSRARRILSILQEPKKPLAERPLEMLEQAHTPRPYRRWMNELEKPVKDCFWIFLHNENTVEVLTTMQVDLMTTRTPVPASGYIGSVEWIAIDYICQHLTLINSILSCLEGHERRELRTHLRTSHFERISGQHLRKASKKYYPYLHEELVIWASRAQADGWCNTIVVTGSARDDSAISCLKRPSAASLGKPVQRHARTQSQFLPELKF